MAVPHRRVWRCTLLGKYFSKLTIGGSLNINGVIRHYKVNSGANVSAGDFVEFVTKCGNSVYNDTSNTSLVTACKLDEKSVFLAYKYSSDSTELRCAVGVIKNGEIFVTSEKTLFTSASIYQVSVASLTSSKTLIAFCSSHNVIGFSCTILNYEIVSTVQATIHDGDVNNNAESVSVIRLSDNEAFITYSCDQIMWDYHMEEIWSVTDTSLTRLSGISKNLSHAPTNIVATALSNDKIFMLYRSGNNAVGLVCTVDGVEISNGSRISLHDASSTYAVAALTDNTILAIIYSDAILASVYTIDGTSITKTNLTTISNDTNGYFSVARVDDHKVFLTYATNSSTLEGVVCTISTDGITLGDKVTLDANRTSLLNNSTVVFSDNSVLVASSGSLGTIIGATIYGNLVIANTEVEPIGTYVQPATSNLHNVGVAKTSGTAGQTVKVYCVGYPSTDYGKLQ